MELWMFIKLFLFLLILITFIICYNRYIRVLNSKHMINRDLEISKLKYSEDDIISHLEYIITEALNEYVLFNIRPKEIFYISNSMESEINENLSEEVPKRISPTLYAQLGLIYDNSYIGKMIGTKIYLIVLDYVLNYNLENNSQKNNISDKK